MIVSLFSARRLVWFPQRARSRTTPGRLLGSSSNSHPQEESPHSKPPINRPQPPAPGPAIGREEELHDENRNVHPQRKRQKEATGH
ncbi:hypothetical protein WR25_06051 [Diploscapter pachys]|uniref:Uncharacterized protein n=1 Tax=Diploscapter pachys TaxID=2018661 RepID=A0A2A2J312_9BILA|nr:hypothetical protein WR25_06051 [Diploscapter pachys]